MENRDNFDVSGADRVAKWLFDNGVSKEEFARDPNKWIDLAIRALKSQEKKALDEIATVAGVGSTTGDLKGFFANATTPKRKRKKKTALRKR